MNAPYLVFSGKKVIKNEKSEEGVFAINYKLYTYVPKIKKHLLFLIKSDIMENWKRKEADYEG